MQRFPVAEAQAGTNLPPMHPHCRSTTMPDTSDATLRKIKRFARDPATGKGITVPGNMSYQEWYGKYVAGDAPPEQKKSLIVPTTKGVTASSAGAILEEQDVRAILDYMTSGVAYPLNAALRTGDALTEAQQQITKNLDIALSKLPDYHGTVYRSLSADLMDVNQFAEEHREFGIVVYPAYTSTSKAVYDPSMKIQLIIQSKHGKDNSTWNSGEQEVLFHRKSSFVVTKVDRYTFYMEEL
jgi:hypothetical protein